MKKVLYFGSLLLILGVLLGACGVDPKIEQQAGNEEYGKFRLLSLEAFGNFEVVMTKAEDEADVNEADFSVRIYGKTLRDAVYDSAWARYADMPEILSIPAGSYTIEACNGEQKSDFNTPYYYGSKEIEVGIQEFTEAEVICRLACVKVSVDFTSSFLENVEDGACLITQNDGVSLQFDENETRSGYIATPTDSVLAVTIRGRYVEDGSEVNKTYYINSVASQQWHKIALSVNTQAGITTEGMVLVDHSITEKESTVLVPGAGDLIDNNGDKGSWDDEQEPTPPVPSDDDELPTIVGSNFNGKAFDVTEPLVLTSEETKSVTLEMTLTAENGGLEHLYLVMNSTDVVLGGIFQGLTSEDSPWDLCHPEGWSEVCVEINDGMVIVDPNDPIRGKKSFVFSISRFMSLLTVPDEAEYYNHSFKITVVDANGGTTSQTLVIRCSAE